MHHNPTFVQWCNIQLVSQKSPEELASWLEITAVMSFFFSPLQYDIYNSWYPLDSPLSSECAYHPGRLSISSISCSIRTFKDDSTHINELIPRKLESIRTHQIQVGTQQHLPTLIQVLITVTNYCTCTTYCFRILQSWIIPQNGFNGCCIMQDIMSPGCFH